MKPLEKDELFQNLSEFLKQKGVELKEGSYTRRVQKGCALLAEAINASQNGLVRAKTEFDRKLDQMRQVIHEKTAPRPKAGSAPPKPPPAGEPASAAPKSRATKPRPKKKTKRSKPGSPA